MALSSRFTLHNDRLRYRNRHRRWFCEGNGLIVRGRTELPYLLEQFLSRQSKSAENRSQFGRDSASFVTADCAADPVQQLQVSSQRDRHGPFATCSTTVAKLWKRRLVDSARVRFTSTSLVNWFFGLAGQPRRIGVWAERCRLPACLLTGVPNLFPETSPVEGVGC